ncbi:fatty acyl-CoA reductase 2, chloroplastic-like [Phragmites australis]|uniref:fatty acyl-CoA reductase 2, chloroplastic-like n=1 Tax=Phragmites australis TaxID=29695 RepID=UPI002D78A1AE|nr:fatty acyl-CoA reductase 2, chloroplastic-like [Phragmites australis]
MESSCVNLSGRAVVAAKRTPSFGVSIKRGRAHGGRGVLLPLSLRKHSNGSVACSSGGGSRPSTFPVHGGDSGARPASAADKVGGGIGIAEFLGGKNFLITGGTGFLAKVLIEKILRTNPDVGKIYVMIKAKDSEAALKRLQNEVVDTELFRCLRKIHGKDYHNFVARKLVPVNGDVREANLGITTELADEIAEEVDIIVNSAGNTNFRERYDVAMDINTLGPFRIMSFAQRFRRLKLFLHVSTAYVNGQRQGVVLEKPFRLGDTIAKELGSSHSSEHKNGAVLDIEAEIKLAFGARRHSDDSASFSQEMKDLGLERAKLHGWQDTYVFTKAMGEMVINCMRGEIPVVTIRPSVIESTVMDPFPGWIQGNRMVDPVIINYGKGLMTSFLGDPDCIFDVIPVDMVVNATLASMAKHGRARGPAAGMHVYQVSSSANPLPFRDLFRFFFQHFTRWPLIDAAGQPILVQPMRFCDSMEQYVSHVETNTLLRSVRRAASSERLRLRARDLRAKAVEQIIHLGRIYEPYTFYGGRFDSVNTEALLAEMSAEERATFHLDVQSMDWMDYFTDVHIPGLKKHVMKGTRVAVKPLLPDASLCGTKQAGPALTSGGPVAVDK